jgi:outer membrane protein assembly factor BamD
VGERVEDAKDRLVAMNRPVPEASQAAIAEDDAEMRSRQPVRFTDKTLDLIKHSPMTVEAAHVGEPTMGAPNRTLAPDITKENVALFNEARGAVKPASAAAPTTAVNEPPRSDQPSAAPLAGGAAGSTGVGVQVLNENGDSGKAADPNALLQPVVPNNPGAAPAPEAPAAAPDQQNEIKPGTAQQVPPPSAGKNADKKPKADLSDESSSKKKKKKGLAKLNPF